jgi:CTP:phosphocholine cytidylyltransferase-like protein
MELKMRSRKKGVVISPKRKSSKYQDFVTIVLLHDQPAFKLKNKTSPALINIDKFTLLEYQLKIINKKFKNYEVIVCTGFLCDQLNLLVKKKYKKYNIRIIENSHFTEYNSCESARLCLQNTTNDKILIIDGKILFDEKIFNNLSFTEPFAICCKDKNETLEIGINTDQNRNISHFSYGARYTWSEIVFLCGNKLLSDLEQKLSEISFKKKFLFEAINFIATKHIIRKTVKSSKVLKIQSMKTLENIRN